MTNDDQKTIGCAFFIGLAALSVGVGIHYGAAYGFALFGAPFLLIAILGMLAS